MDTLQMQIILSGLEASSSIIPDVIPDEKKPLDPPWVVEYDEDYDDDYEESHIDFHLLTPWMFQRENCLILHPTR